jgi:uncharacterized protein YbcC (UPF0753/DUF2309 family)
LSISVLAGPSEATASQRLCELQHAIEHVAHLLPSQGPIEVFVHHNTLHAFEDLTFEAAARHGYEVYGCEPCFSEARYRAEMELGRIRPDDLSAALLEDLGEEATRLIGFMGTRFHLRMAMLEHPLHTGTDAELRWIIAETDALARFRPETPERFRRSMIERTRNWLSGAAGDAGTSDRDRLLRQATFDQIDPAARDAWSDGDWESCTVHLLWHLCRAGAKRAATNNKSVTNTPPRVRDLLLQATGHDADALVHELLVRFTAAYLDQGFSNWRLPNREAGFWGSFRAVYSGSRPAERWLGSLSAELNRIERDRLSPLECISDSLDQLGVDPDDYESYVTQTLLALRGWAGMLWQMETNAAWAVRPAPPGSLVEFLAVRLLLDRLAAAAICDREFGHGRSLRQVTAELSAKPTSTPHVTTEQRAYSLFQLAQSRGWSPEDLWRQSDPEWSRLLEEVDAFDELERRRVYHRAYERGYRQRALDALAAHAKPAMQRVANQPARRPEFQFITCIDDREESFRRHLEEVAPECETRSAAGFFAVAMYFRCASEAHFRPLCPIVITPSHYVTEEVAYSLSASSRQREDARRFLGTATHRLHMGSRSFVGGMATAALGSLASIPMVARILFPRLTAQARRMFGSLLQPPAVTELHLTRECDPPGSADEHIGYSLTEKINIVTRLLQDLGLTSGFARLIVFAGHGSGSLNNPHESAYNCGACSGGRGGPNARAFAEMANDPQVRQALVGKGLTIPADTVFLGAYHNTCDEDVVFFDLDVLPRTHRREFERMRSAIDAARARNAHERCRRFESARLTLSAAEALSHVESRAEDLSQARPEYNHATCAMCIVGRRDWSRGLFLDRRAFLNSYDSTQDDERGTVLARILAAAVPVCAGISLEYYFSCVDPQGYGCGSKLPHNITSLLGVMEGASGDLRTGLSQQMVEIHEPVRILFVIETSP